MSNEEKSVVKSNLSEVAMFNDLFGDIDFSTLNSSIETLGEVSRDLSDEEKAKAVGILTEWESNVLERLNIRKEDIDSFVNFMHDKNTGYYYRDRDFEMEVGIDGLADLAEKTNTTELFQKYVDAKEKVEDLVFEKPEEEVDDITQTYEEREIAKRKYQLEKAKHEIRCHKAERDVVVTRRTWLRAMMSNEEMRNMLKQVNSYKRKLTKFKSDCKAKSQNARLSVAISSQKARKSLKELLDFAVKI